MFCCNDVEEQTTDQHEPQSSSSVAMNPGLALPGKKGICFLTNEANPQNIERVSRLNPSWSYNWGAKRHAEQPEDIEYIPMIWGGAKTENDMHDRINEQVMPQIEAGTCRRILCFNEPDKPNQSNMTPERCLEFWPQLEKLGLAMVSPACANPLSSEKDLDCCQGVSGCWMKEFMSELEKRGHRCDYLGVHWYGGPNVNVFKKQMQKIYEAYGSKYPLILTEFAIADWKAKNGSPEDNRFSKEQILAFMKEALPWLEKQNWIAGYAWYPFEQTCPQGTSSALFNENNKLTALGRFYKSITKENPEGNQDIEVN